MLLFSADSWTRGLCGDQQEAQLLCEIVHDVWNGHSRSLKVIRCCANWCGIYYFLLALNSNLTSIFNRFWDIAPSLHIHIPPLFQVELEKDGWEQVDMLCCQSAQNIGLSNRKLKSALMCTIWSQCTPVPVPDGQAYRQTDEHHGNRATVPSNQCIANKKYAR